jgi:uncharacterized protein (TIGR00369 family)
MGHFGKEKRHMTSDSAKTDLARIRAQEHANCMVCSPSSKGGLGLQFDVSKDGSVQAIFSCDKAFEGYPNVLHGGLISCLLDGAMTNCMFAHGYAPVTAELNIRFQHPVVIGEPATVRARIGRSSSHLHVLEAEILQNQQVKATATGKFMNRSLSTRGHVAQGDCLPGAPFE